MTFAADIRRWATVHDFAQHLAQHDPAICDWVKGFVLHHTWTPTIAQWRGLTSVEGARDYYINSVPNADGNKGGWPSGPHLFICGDSANPLYNGIFQLTPLNIPGTHAGAKCNPTTWACEVVGRYDNTFWSSATAELVYGVITALYGWADRDPETITGHRFCLNNKTCPGNQVAARLSTIRNEVKQRLLAGATQPGQALLTEHSSIFGAPTITFDEGVNFILKRGSLYTPYDVRVIVGQVFQVCQPVNVDPGRVLAQIIHETSENIDTDPELEPLSSYWAQRPRRNSSGIGVDGEPGHGVIFPTWLDSIQAQVGRLLRYFLKPGQGTEAQQALMETALKWRPLDRVAWGSCTELQHLGAIHNPANAGLPRDKWRSGWAWDGAQYGKRIAEIANAIRGQG